MKDAVVRRCCPPPPCLPACPRHQRLFKGITLFMGFGGCLVLTRMYLRPYLSQQGNFNSSVGPDGYMLSALTCGMSPVTSITEGLQQVPAKQAATNQPTKLSALPHFWFTLACTDYKLGLTCLHLVCITPCDEIYQPFTNIPSNTHDAARPYLTDVRWHFSNVFREGSA